MGIERLKTTVENILNRAEIVRGKGEEATKQAMILPMLEALGYDIWNPDEVFPEYTADTAIKKAGQKEKVDYAILLGGVPKIFIEAKPYGENLEGHHGQLKRYFTSTPSVTLGIITNGAEYRFFTDTGEQNIQDDEPFFIANFASIDQGLDVMTRFQKSVFSGDAIRDFATELTYTAKIIDFLTSEIDVKEGELSESFIRWILASQEMYDGRVTSNVIERFMPISKEALQRVIRKIVRRTMSAIDDGVSTSKGEPEPAEGEQTEGEPLCVDEDLQTQIDQSTADDCVSVKKGINTTEEELECFAIVKKQFECSALAGKTIYNPSARKDVPLEISYKDTHSYFNIYFNKSSWWNLRLSVESKVKWAGIDIDPEIGSELLPQEYKVLPPNSIAQFRVQINSPDDLHALNQLIYASFEKTIRDRQQYSSDE